MPLTVEITVVGTVIVDTKPVGQEEEPETVLVDVIVLTPVPVIVVVAPGKVTVEMRPVGQEELPEIVLVETTVLTPVPGIVVVAPGKVTVLTDVQDPVTVVGTVKVETRPVGQDEVPDTVLVDITVLTPVPGIVVVAPGKVTVLTDVQAPVTVVEIKEQVAPVDDDPYPQPPQPPPTCVPQTVRVLTDVVVEAVQVFMDGLVVTVVGTVSVETEPLRVSVDVPETTVLVEPAAVETETMVLAAAVETDV